MYVNDDYRAEDAAGMLMHDFFCDNPAQMHYEELAKRADSFKHETKGMNAVCKIIQDLIREEHDWWLNEERTNSPRHAPRQ